MVRQQGLGHQNPTLKLQVVKLQVEGRTEGDQRRTVGGTSARIGSINSSPARWRLGLRAGGLLIGSSKTTLAAQRSESVTVIARFRITVTVSLE